MSEEQVRETRVVLQKPKRPVGRPPKHGAFSGIELMPVAQTKESDIRAILSGAKVSVGAADTVPIMMLAKNLAIIELILRFFSAHGLFDEDNKLRQGDMKVYLAAVNASARLCDMLGMTPISRVRLGIGLIQAKRDLDSMMNDPTEAEPV